MHCSMLTSRGHCPIPELTWVLLGHSMLHPFQPFPFSPSKQQSTPPSLTTSLITSVPHSSSFLSRPVGGTLSRHASLPTQRQQLLSRVPLSSSLSSASHTDDTFTLFAPPTHVVFPLANGLTAATGTHPPRGHARNTGGFVTPVFTTERPKGLCCSWNCCYHVVE